MKCTHFEELGAKMLQLVENKCIAVKSLNDEQKLFNLYQNLLLKDSNSVFIQVNNLEVITLHNVCAVQRDIQ